MTSWDPKDPRVIARMRFLRRRWRERHPEATARTNYIAKCAHAWGTTYRAARLRLAQQHCSKDA